MGKTIKEYCYLAFLYWKCDSTSYIRSFKHTYGYSYSILINRIWLFW